MARSRNSKKSRPSINDIRKPESESGFAASWVTQGGLSGIHVPRSDRGVKILSVFVAIIVLLAILVIGYFVFLRVDAAQSTNAEFRTLGELIQNPFSLNSNNVAGSSSAPYGTNLLSSIPILAGIPASFGDIAQFSQTLIQTEVDFGVLRLNGLDWFLNGGGPQLVSYLSGIDSNLKALGSLGNSIDNLESEFSTLSSGTAVSFFDTGTNLERDTEGLDSLINLLKAPSSSVLIVFENTDVERPGGGRIAAYANVAIASSSLSSFNIYNPATLQPYDQKVVPPLQLQTIETAWKISDTDWFANFPTSAAEILNRFQNAEQAEGNPEQYSAVVAVTPQVIEDLVDVLGPLQLQDGTNLTAVNLNSQINRLGEIAFLKQFLPALQERAENLSSSDRANLEPVALDWVSNRDVMFYFTDPTLEEIANDDNIGGQLYQTGNGYVGDYLSVVHADIVGNSGSQDSLSLNSTIQSDGTIENDLDITLENNSDSLNQEYFQVIVPSGAKLVSVIGNTHDTVLPPINYSKSGYIEDPEVEQIESTRDVDPDSLAESYSMGSNTVFGFWLSLLPGVTQTVSVTYDSPAIALQSGENYQFVVERQPGDSASLIYSLQAPSGWNFKQAGNSNYLYSSQNLPGRTILNLNLDNGS